jgi:hypothetical protein
VCVWVLEWDKIFLIDEVNICRAVLCFLNFYGGRKMFLMEVNFVNFESELI